MGVKHGLSTWNWDISRHILQILRKLLQNIVDTFNNVLLTAGSDRVPVGGMQEMTFKISKLKVRGNWKPVQ